MIVGLFYWFDVCYYEFIDDVFVVMCSFFVVLKVGGYVMGIFVMDNQYVNVGDLFVKIDECDYWIVIEQVDVQVVVFKVNIDNVQVQFVVQQEQIKQVEVQFEQVQVQFQFLQEEFVCVQDLFEKGVGMV